MTTETAEKTASPLELFFDLVFVYAITQVSVLVASDLTAVGFAHGALVLAMLWWAWSQFTWAGNLINIEPRKVRLAIIVAMAPAFVMAQGVSSAFDGGAPWVAWGYAVVRALGTWMMWKGVEGDPEQRKAVMTYLRISIIGPVVLIVGSYLSDPALSLLWLAGLSAEILSAAVGGRESWRIDAGHFAERHGLIVIIALGESIVVVGATVADREPTRALAGLLMLALAGTATLWWSYFDYLKDRWEDALRRVAGEQAGRMARDVYSILHYPILFGIVLYAIVSEETIAHPDEPLPRAVLVTLVLAVGLFLGGQILANYRAVKTWLWARIAAVIAIVATAPLVTDIDAVVVFAAGTLIGVVMLIFETVTGEADRLPELTGSGEGV